MIIERNKYLKKLIDKKNNGLIKIISGPRRSGKTFLLFNLYKKHLLSEGIPSKQIIEFSFENRENVMRLDKYLPDQKTVIKNLHSKIYLINANKFIKYIYDIVKNKKQKYYILLDEIQLLEDFVFVLNSFLSNNNLDVYVTGSNSKMLSNDIITEFRGRGDEVKLHPLSFKEYFNASNLDFEKAYLNYQYFGGMPGLLKINNHEDKEIYLSNLFKETYLRDLIERNKIKNIDNFETLIKLLASNISNYVNCKKIENIYKTKLKENYHHDTIKKHLEFLKDAFIINEANRYDIKGNCYIGANSKYYFQDIGIRNALINFKQEDLGYVMENIIYNELLIREYKVDIGFVEILELNKMGKYTKKQLEADFICRKTNQKIYIQSCYSLNELNKFNKEKKSLINIKDSFRKIIIVKDNIKRFYTDEGIEIISLKDFLLNDL